jgi:hypothetical protein
LVILVAGFFISTSADTIATITFEDFSTGTVNSQHGWISLGSVGLGCAVYDHAVVSNAIGAPSTFGSQSLRISNAVISGCFGDNTFSMPLADEAGESAATSAGLSGGTRQQHFEAQFEYRVDDGDAAGNARLLSLRIAATVRVKVI